MTLILLIVVWAMVLGFSPGLALIAVAVAYLALDRYSPESLRSIGKTLRGWRPPDDGKAGGRTAMSPIVGSSWPTR